MVSSPATFNASPRDGNASSSSSSSSTTSFSSPTVAVGTTTTTSSSVAVAAATAAASSRRRRRPEEAPGPEKPPTADDDDDDVMRDHERSGLLGRPPVPPSWTAQNQWIVLAVASGACAAFNGVFAKLTTNSLTSQISQAITGALGLKHYEGAFEIVFRGMFFGLNLAFNGVMWTLFTKALARGSSTTQVSIMNTSANFVITALLGLAIFAENLPPLWWLGAALLVAGNVIIGRKDNNGNDDDGGGGGAPSEPPSEPSPRPDIVVPKVVILPPPDDESKGEDVPLIGDVETVV
jgi:uncharacterized membrane protein